MVRWHPTRWEPWEHFCASAIYAAPTAAGESFLDNTALYIAHFLGRGSPVWYLDQIALFAAYLQAKPQCVIRYIDPAAIFFVNPSMPVDPPPGAVFWTIFNRIDANAPSLEHPVFIRYAARKGRAAQP